MDSLIYNQHVFANYEYTKEVEFERAVVANVGAIFGERSIYIDIKKKIGGSIVTIPDGYLIDFSFDFRDNGPTKLNSSKKRQAPQIYRYNPNSQGKRLE